MIRGKVDGRIIHEQSTTINQEFSNPERRRRQPRAPKYSSIPPFLPYFQPYSAATLRQCCGFDNLKIITDLVNNIHGHYIAEVKKTT
jgi:hypothetical protein